MEKDVGANILNRLMEVKGRRSKIKPVEGQKIRKRMMIRRGRKTAGTGLSMVNVNMETIVMANIQ